MAGRRLLPPLSPSVSQGDKPSPAPPATTSPPAPPGSRPPHLHAAESAAALGPKHFAVPRLLLFYFFFKSTTSPVSERVRVSR